MEIMHPLNVNVRAASAWGKPDTLRIQGKEYPVRVYRNHLYGWMRNSTIPFRVKASRVVKKVA